PFVQLHAAGWHQTTRRLLVLTVERVQKSIPHPLQLLLRPFVPRAALQRLLPDTKRPHPNTAKHPGLLLVHQLPARRLGQSVEQETSQTFDTSEETFTRLANTLLG